MRIVTRRAWFQGHCPEIRAPVTATPAMDAGFPIAEGWSVAASAQSRAVSDAEFAAITRLKRVEFCFVMAVEADIVATVSAMAHHDILVFGGNDDDTIRVKLDRGRFVFFVTDVAIEIRKVRTGRRK